MEECNEVEATWLWAWHRMTAQKVLASVIVPHSKTLQGEERISWEMEIVVHSSLGSFFKFGKSLHSSV